MDYLAKNFFVSPEGLQMIDWSEVKIGRVGFDGGAYLSAIFRQGDLTRFAKVRAEFLSAYAEALDERFDQQSALRNVDYFFRRMRCGISCGPGPLPITSNGASWSCCMRSMSICWRCL
ncbi:hypothetical protein PMI31_00537 [Pseudomonas sp. GM55]|nr:hypothetical protein [Pseudomonas sp. GM55]EJM78144.1 hypothetical protein PMI31_00537 [Pseudomonas sp. GM55]